MEDKIVYYYEKDNFLFGGDIIAMSYKLSLEEKEKYKFNGNEIITFIKCKEKINKENKNVNYSSFISRNFSNGNILLRIQSECFLGNYGDSHCDCESQRVNFAKLIGENGGIFIHLPQEAQGWGLHYKVEELELQVSGRDKSGNYVGKKNRDEAQKYILKSNEFRDVRNYEIIEIILNILGVKNNKISLITDSDKKIEELKKKKLDVVKYNSDINVSINSENISEYLVKIINNSHNYDDRIVSYIFDYLKNREYNHRTISLILDAVNDIENNKKCKIPIETKEKIMAVYNKIFCSEEKEFIIEDENVIKTQNHFACKVKEIFFKNLIKNYGYNVFDRISLEKSYYFKNIEENEVIKIRTSEILDSTIKSQFLKGQKHAEKIVNIEKHNKVFQQEVSISKLRSYFENPLYEFIKRVEMVTIISEGTLDGLNIYIKRLPKLENRYLDIYGSYNKIKEFVIKFNNSTNGSIISSISDRNLEDENFSEYNLRFADINAIIEEEMSIFNITKEE